jgi:hypothetical protein
MPFELRLDVPPEPQRDIRSGSAVLRAARDAVTEVPDLALVSGSLGVG